MIHSNYNVELENTYCTADSAKLFTIYITESQRKAFLNDFAKCKFFIFHFDGSTGAGNLEDELIAVQYSMKDSSSEEVKSVTQHLTVCNQAKCDADGLLNCLSLALNQIGIKDILDMESI